MVIDIILFLFFLYMAIYTLITIISSTYALRELNQRKLFRQLVQHIDYQVPLPPISIFIPAYNEEKTILKTIESLRYVDYPEFEIIVINDGSTDNTLEVLKENFALKERNPFIKQRLKTKKIRHVYEYQGTDLPLIVIDKENGGKSDALNVGINVSKYPLFVTVDADSMLQKDSLQKIVMPYLQYDHVVAVGGDVKISNGVTLEKGEVTSMKIPHSPILVFQILEYFRAFLTTRVWFNRFNGNLIISGAFGLFDKNAALAVNGYSTNTIGEDMDLVIKLHSYYKKNQLPYRIEYSIEAICWTQGPRKWRDLKGQRIRWHIGLMQSLFSHRYIFFNTHYGWVSLFSFMYFFMYELINPIVIVLALIFSIYLLFRKMVYFKFVIAFIILYLSYTVINAWSSLYLERYFYNDKISKLDQFRLILYCILENFGYRQWNLFCKFIALFSFKNNKEKEWGEIERE